MKLNDLLQKSNWEEVEKYNAEFPANERLDKNREYGLIYYYRKGETIE